MTDWTDNRLAEAFEARAAAVRMSGELVAETLAAVRGTQRSGPRVLAIRRLGAATGAALVLAVVGVGFVGSRPVIDPDKPAPTAFGLRVMSVDEAIAVRDSGVDDRELAVRGFYRAPDGKFCPRVFLDDNPTLPTCSNSRLMSRNVPVSEPPLYDRNGEYSFGPTVDLSVDLVPRDALPKDPEIAVPLTVVGHFDDRRASLCSESNRAGCANTFLVDRIVEVDGRAIGTQTDRNIGGGSGTREVEPTSTDAEIDRVIALIDPSLRVLSRSLVATNRVASIEPVYASDGDRAESLASPAIWLVVALPIPDAAGRAVARTYLIPDGVTNSVVELTRDGPVPVIAPPTPSATPVKTPLAPPPSNEWAWPEAVLGLPVNSVADARAQWDGEADDTEVAIRGWYVPAKDAIRCRPRTANLRPPEMTCPVGSEWLLEDPERLEDPVSGERHLPAGPALKVVVDPTVPFDIPVGWFDEGLEPLPVVVLGHFGDRRAQSFLVLDQLVVDALVWRAGADASQQPVLLTETISIATEVAALVESKSDTARAIWIAVNTGSSLSEMDQDASAFAPELVTSPATWIVRRLVDDGGRPVVRMAYVLDGTDRVWVERWPRSYELATTFDVGGGSSDATDEVIVRVADDSRLLTGVRAIRGDEFAGVTFAELPVPPDLGSTAISVASVPGSDREIVVRWIGESCDEVWRLDVSTFSEHGGVLVSPRRLEPVENCDGRLVGVVRGVVLQFAARTPLETIEANTNPSGG